MSEVLSRSKVNLRTTMGIEIKRLPREAGSGRHRYRIANVGAAEQTPITVASRPDDNKVAVNIRLIPPKTQTAKAFMVH